MKEIVVNEKIVVKDPVTTGEVVALPGIKGDKGDAFTYDDFTPEQIAELQRPATESAKVAISAAQRAENAADSVQGAVEDAEQASQSAQQAATAAQEAVKMTYEEQVVAKIRERYSIDDELAILRQRYTKPDEFEAYNAYAESCKEEARLLLEKQNE